MANLIYRDELIKEIRSTPNFGKEWDKALCEAIVKDAPTVDAVEVVRCKDCKYRDEEITIPAPDESPYKSFTFAKCPCRSFNLGDDFFCGKGKRKEGEQDDKA